MAPKMFSKINFMVGREGSRRTSMDQQYGGPVELEFHDNWAEMTSISQLEEALGNMVRVWAAMWPGDYGPAVIQGVVLKHKGFKIFDNVVMRKRFLEEFIDGSLAENATRAGNKLPPLAFPEVDIKAKEIIDRRAEVASMRSIDRTSDGPKDRLSYNRPNNNGNASATYKKSEFKELVKGIGGKDICLWYNMRSGCTNSNCDRSHVCANIPKNKTNPCKGNHSKKECNA